MQTSLDNAILFLVALFVAGAMAFSGCHLGGVSLALAQPRGLTPHLVLARVCAHEASLPVHDLEDADADGNTQEWVRRAHPELSWGDDCYLIHEAFLRGAERYRASSPHLSDAERYVMFARNYSERAIDAPIERDGNRWAADLQAGPHEPRGWHGVRWDGVNPRGAPVEAWRFVWLLTGGIARMGLGEVAMWSLCEAPVTDWGGTMDGDHAAAIGLIEVECVGQIAANTPYRRPWL